MADIDAEIEKILYCQQYDQCLGGQHHPDCWARKRPAVAEFCRGLKVQFDARLDEADKAYVLALDRGDEWARQVGPLQSKVAELERELKEREEIRG